jgi:hypothetical protein
MEQSREFLLKLELVSGKYDLTQKWTDLNIFSAF